MININKELSMQHFHGGIKLTEPSAANSHKNIGEVFNLPIQSYFYNLDDSFSCVNETMAAQNGFHSEKDAVNNTISAVVSKESAAKIIANNRLVHKTEQIQIIQESIVRNDDLFLEGISVKVPWYDDSNRLIGIFGCSIVIDSMQSYAEGLANIAKTGLLNLVNKSHVGVANDIYFSKREQDILHLLVRGKTAREIASALGLSKRTVEHYLENTKDKARVASKSELIEKVFGWFQ